MVIDNERARPLDATDSTLSDEKSPTTDFKRPDPSFAHNLVASSLKLAIALGVSIVLALFLYSRVPTRLAGDVDVVGYASYANWTYEPSIAAYRLAVYAIPFLAMVVYGLLSWRGPLRTSGSARYEVVEGDDELTPDLEPDDSLQLWAVAISKLLVPAAVVFVAVSSASRQPDTSSRVVGGIAAALYVLAVVGIARGAARLQLEKQGASSSSSLEWMSRLNATGGAYVAIASLWFVSQRSTVFVVADGGVDQKSWLPWWLALGAAVAVGAGAWTLSRRGFGTPRIERCSMVGVVGSTLVFLSKSKLPGALGPFQGFDDAQELAGAALLARGQSPWDNLLFIHGLYEDVLRGTFSFVVFEWSRWGSAAASSVILAPLGWVVMYLLAAWAGRKNHWFVIASGILLVSGLLPNLNGRFFLLPLALILLGETLARRSRPWCFALMLAMIAHAILVPETIILLVGLLPALLIADYAQRTPGASLWPTLWRTRWCTLFGAGILAVWLIYLSLVGSLVAFIDYYRVFGPGHTASGAIPPAGISTLQWFEFGLGIFLVVVAFGMIFFRLRSGGAWAAQDYSIVAIAVFAALYGEKALGRFDGGHVDQVFTITLPLALLIVGSLMHRLDRSLHVLVVAPIRRWRIRKPLTMMIAICLAVSVPSAFWALYDSPTNSHVVVPEEPLNSRLGYTQPGAIDLGLLNDLNVLLTRYAQNDQPIFDMTSSPGYVHFLLDRLPGTRFYHVDMAITRYSQELVIDELEESQPPLIIFDSASIGLPEWDFLSSHVRHYMVTQYVLDGWSPLIDARGVLLLLRNDLVSQVPALPQLDASTTSDLWFRGTACDWGFVPNFLPTSAAGPSQTLEIEWGSGLQAHASGWAVDPLTRGPVAGFVLVRDGRVLDSTVSSAQRPDVADSIGPSGLESGFTLAADLDQSQSDDVLEVLAVTADGEAHFFGSQVPTEYPDGVTTLSGSLMPVGPPIDGGFDSLDFTPASGRIELPEDQIWSDYQLATFTAIDGLGDSQITLYDQPAAPGRTIVARSLASEGTSLPVRVGSCIQWHGYSTHTLYITQVGGSPAETVTLSGVV